jgi:hypothetical protein
MTVTLSYSCANATDSQGGGFFTNDQLSGSTTTVIAAPPAGTNTANYMLTCINQGQTQSAQCAVQIAQPFIDLVATPSSVASGATSTIGWVTGGMQSCVISSPQNSAFTSANVNDTSVSGTAQTPPLTAPMTAVLTCQTSSGGTMQASAPIAVGGVNASATAGTNANAVTVSSSADGGTIAHGGTVSISWSSTSQPSGSMMSLWLANEQTQSANRIIAGGLSANGTYTWSVPAVGATCNANAMNVCDTDLVQGDSYAIEAVSYTPSNAYVGDGAAPSSPVTPTFGNAAIGQTFTVDDSSSGGE